MTDEQVLVIPRKIFEENEEVKEMLMMLLEPDQAFYMNRSDAERDETHLQIIPYILITDGYRVLSSRRTKKGKEERLHERKSLGIGGHVNPGETIDQAALREIFEETGITKDLLETTDTLFTILLDEPEVCRVHLGIACIAKVTKETLDALDRHDGELELNPIAIEHALRDLKHYEEWSQQFEQTLQNMSASLRNISVTIINKDCTQPGPPFLFINLSERRAKNTVMPEDGEGHIHVGIDEFGRPTHVSIMDPASFQDW